MMYIRYRKTCEYCGKEFMACRSSHRFCCNACGKAARRKRMHSKLVEEHKQQKIECPICGKKFVYSKEHRVYCSSECARAAQISQTMRHNKDTAAILEELSYQPSLRPCAGKCGRMITDYRCPECWAKYRREHAGDCFDF